MDKLLEDYEIKLIEPECVAGSERFGVELNLPNDISAVFPYLNALMDNARYDHGNRILILREHDQAYALRPTEIRIARAHDPSQAEQLAAELVEKINQVWQEREVIPPRLTERKIPGVMDIFKLLPRTNCRQCGYTTCMAYAADLSQSMTHLVACPPLCLPEYAENREKLSDLVSSD